MPMVERSNIRASFARAALTGLLSNIPRYQLAVLSRQAYEIADEMLQERAAIKPSPRRAATPTLTDAEREAIAAAIAYVQPVGNYDTRVQETLLALLERLGGER